MKRIDYEAGCKMLREVGFTVVEIERLNKLRSSYEEQEIGSATSTRQYQKHNRLFGRIMNMILDICKMLATSGDIYWMDDHSLF